MIDKIILNSIIAIVVMVIYSFLTNSTGRKIEADQHGQFHLRINKLYGLFGVVLVLLGFVFLIVIPLTVDRDSSMIIMIILMLFIMWGIGIACLLYYKNHKVTYNTSTITVTSVYGKTKSISWSDITDIHFSAFSGLLTICDKREKVKIHQHMVGLSSFMDKIASETKWTAEELKIPIKKKSV